MHHSDYRYVQCDVNLEIKMHRDISKTIAERNPFTTGLAQVLHNQLLHYSLSYQKGE